MDKFKESLDVAIDELEYALLTGNEENKEFYIKNAIRFIEEAKEEMKEEKDGEVYWKRRFDDLKHENVRLNDKLDFNEIKQMFKDVK